MKKFSKSQLISSHKKSRNEKIIFLTKDFMSNLFAYLLYIFILEQLMLTFISLPLCYQASMTQVFHSIFYSELLDYICFENLMIFFSKALISFKNFSIFFNSNY